MLGAKWILEKRGMDIVDAKVSRQAITGPGLLEERGERLPTYVVVHLGTNGTYTLEQCTDLVKAAGPERTVFLVTIKVPRKWEEVNNAMLRDCASKFRADRVKLLDWNAVASARPELLYADGVHLRPDGAKAFARLITRAVTAAKRRDETKANGVLAAPVR
jgi:lysophospholipase L1-like esterase